MVNNGQAQSFKLSITISPDSAMPYPLLTTRSTTRNRKVRTILVRSRKYFWQVKPPASQTQHPDNSALLMGALVFSLQYLTISKILLLCFDPTIPIVGPARRTWADKIDRLTVKHLKSMCGIGLSHHSYGPAMILTSLGISLCGDRVGDVDDRTKICEILGQTQAEHAFPTTHIREELMRAWGSID